MRHKFCAFLVVMNFLFFMVSCKKGSTTMGDRTVFQDLNVNTPEVTLYARVAGNLQSGKVLIAINGGPGLTSNYMLDLEQLAGRDLAVVTYDQRGMGKSSKPPAPGSPASYTLLKYAEDVEAIRQALHVERIHLFGHSFGGIIAMQYAVLYPEHVASLIFFGGGPPTWQGIQACNQKMLARVQSLIQVGVILPMDQWKAGGIDPILPAYFYDPKFTFPEDALGGPPQFDQSVRDLTYQNVVKLDLRPELASLQKRVLLMIGRDDPFGLQMAEAVRDALVHSTVDYVVIDQCGHFWHECPDAFYPRLRKFLKK
jgi:pimeloyl-ACP methyl ester carboxylesterase